MVAKSVPWLRRELAGAMPAVNAVLGRLGFARIVAAALPRPDPPCALAPAAVIGVLVRNLACGRQPLYELADWPPATSRRSWAWHRGRRHCATTTAPGGRWTCCSRRTGPR
jgi:hypothetical protein